MASSQIFSLRLSPAPAPPPAQWLRIPLIGCGFGFSCRLVIVLAFAFAAAAAALPVVRMFGPLGRKAGFLQVLQPVLQKRHLRHPSFGWLNIIFHLALSWSVPIISSTGGTTGGTEGTFPSKKSGPSFPLFGVLALLAFFGGFTRWRVTRNSRFCVNGLPTTSSTATTSPSTPGPSHQAVVEASLQQQQLELDVPALEHIVPTLSRTKWQEEKEWETS